MSPKGKTLAVPSCYHHAILIRSRVAGRAGNLYSELPSATHGWQTSKSCDKSCRDIWIWFYRCCQNRGICVLNSAGWSFWLLSKRLLPLWPSASTCQKRNRNGHFKAIPWSIPTSNWPFFLFNKGMNQIKLISDSVMLSAVKNNISQCLTAHTHKTF